MCVSLCNVCASVFMSKTSSQQPGYRVVKVAVDLADLKILRSEAILFVSPPFVSRRRCHGTR